MKLYLLRHGQAGDADPLEFPDDDLRPLTGRGRRETRELGRELRRREIAFDRIVSSELVRARETATIVADSLDLAGRTALLENLRPFSEPAKFLKTLASLQPIPQSLLVVGHEPFLGRLISFLCTGGTGMHVNMKKGALCRLEIETWGGAEGAVLEWLLPPLWTMRDP